MKYISIILFAFIIFFISFILGAYNDQVVTFNYIFAQSQLRVSTLLVSLFFIGFTIGLVICGLFWFRAHLALLRVKSKVKRLEQRIMLLETSNSVSVGATTIAHKE